MFDQALNRLVYITVTFVLFLLFTLILVWYNQSIDAAQLPPPWRFTIDECHQMLPDFVILWRTIYCLSLSRGGREWGWRVEDISNLLRNGRSGPEVIVADRYKGRRGSKKGQIEHSLTVERSLIISCWSRATKISKVYLIFWNLTLSCIILKNGQSYFENITFLFTPQDF